MNVFCGLLLISFISYSAAIIVPPPFDDIVEGDIEIFEHVITLNTYPATCSLVISSGFTTADENDYSISATTGGGPLNLNSFSVASPFTATFTLSIVNDDDDVESLFFGLSCDSANPNPEGRFVKGFRLLLSSDAAGDPHFSQYIWNRYTNKTTRICYDVTAERNQFIYIFSQPKFETQLFGQLKDDYYMHKIILKIRNHYFEADVNEITCSFNKIHSNWDDNIRQDWLEFDGIQFRQKKGKFQVRRGKTEHLFFGIIRRKDSFGKYYLDVSVSGLSTDYSGMEGLFGKIGNSHISVYPPVQESSDKTTVVVNEQKTYGYKQVRQGSECTLIKVNDLLYPHVLDDYIVSEIVY